MKKIFVNIGKKTGISIPKKLLDKAKLRGEVEIVIHGDRIVIQPKAWDPRAGWEEAIKKSIAKYGNELTEEDREWLNAPLDAEFDEKEWTW
jgi:antitoxin component of MazEF toxin-antitoxin module